MNANLNRDSTRFQRAEECTMHRFRICEENDNTIETDIIEAVGRGEPRRGLGL
jgi:hypothetical protein